MQTLLQNSRDLTPDHLLYFPFSWRSRTYFLDISEENGEGEQRFSNSLCTRSFGWDSIASGTPSGYPTHLGPWPVRLRRRRPSSSGGRQDIHPRGMDPLRFRRQLTDWHRTGGRSDSSHYRVSRVPCCPHAPEFCRASSPGPDPKPQQVSRPFKRSME